MELARRFGGKKFMWEGQAYSTEEEAMKTAQKYQADGFQAELVAEDNGFYIFTRREIKEAVTEGKPL
jgi:hypothetical protein